MTATGFSVTNPNDALSRGVWVPVPAQTVCVRLSSHTSGSATGRVIATAQRTMVMLAGTDGSTPRVPVVTNTTPASNDYAIAVRCIGCPGGTGGTTVNDNSTFTGGTTQGTPAFALYDNTPPAVTDGNTGLVRMNANRDLRVAPVDGEGDSATQDSLNAWRTVLVAVPPVGGISGPSGAVTANEKCNEFRVPLRMTTATTTELVPLTSGQHVYICDIFVFADGDTDVELVEGTGVDCADNQVTIAGPYDLSSTNGRAFTRGKVGAVRRTTTTGRAVCAKSSAAVPVTIEIKF